MRGLLLLVATIVFGAESSDLVGKIKQNGKAIDASAISSVKDPFFGESKGYAKGLRETNATKYEPTFSLKAVFGDRALINDKWIAKGESLEGYTLVNVNPKEVLMQRDNEQKTVSIASVRVAW